jgi:hypothetical protein
MSRQRHRYRFRARLRRALPVSLAGRIPLGKRDCGAHVFYNVDGRTEACYYCIAARPYDAAHFQSWLEDGTGATKSVAAFYSESTEAAVAILQACVLEGGSRDPETGAVSSQRQLQWGPLLELAGGEGGVRRLLDLIRPRADIRLMELIELGEKYLGGWRPTELGRNDEEKT